MTEVICYSTTVDNVIRYDRNVYQVVARESLPGAGGTVTSFSAGNLSPLFTSSVATSTSTPALTFSLSTHTANTIFAGPTTGGAAAPTFRALVAADIPDLSATYLPITGATLPADLVLTSVTFSTTYQTRFSTSSGVITVTDTGTGAVTTVAPSGVSSPLLVGGLGTLDVRTLSGNITVATNYTQAFYNSGGADRVVTLPAAGNLYRWVGTNTGTGGVIVVNSPGGSFLADVFPGETASIVCDGTTWRVAA